MTATMRAMVTRTAPTCISSGKLSHSTRAMGPIWGSKDLGWQHKAGQAARKLCLRAQMQHESVCVMGISWTYSHRHCVAHAISLVGWLKHVKLLSPSLSGCHVSQIAELRAQQPWQAFAQCCINDCGYSMFGLKLSQHPCRPVHPE